METLKTTFIQHCIASKAFIVALESGYGVALWRLPDSPQVRVVVDFSDNFLPQTLDLEQVGVGFVFSPFQNPDLKENYFIRAEWEYCSCKELIEPSFGASTQQKNFYQNLQKSLRQDTRHVLPKYQLSDTGASTHLDLIKKSISYIKQGHFQKIVLSRRQHIDFEHEIPLELLFESLCKQYPHAMVSLVHLPGVGTWVGASPEVLVSLDKNNVFRTMALAGTQVYKPQMPLWAAVWTQKEIEEQALVSRYIINALKKIRVREFEEDGPKTVQAGNLMHLCTDFWIDLNMVNYPNLTGVMLQLLHPTSAVCGMPREETLKFILANENYPREFYSGFLGQVNFQDETHLFVNLRCMQIVSAKQAYIYAGGGITAHSTPEKEWQETVYKMQTLLSVFTDAALNKRR